MAIDSDGSEGRIAFRSYPTVSLRAVKKFRDAAKRRKSAGIDPVQTRKIQKLKSATPTGNTSRIEAECMWANAQTNLNQNRTLS